MRFLVQKPATSKGRTESIVGIRGRTEAMVATIPQDALGGGGGGGGGRTLALIFYTTDLGLSSRQYAECTLPPVLELTNCSPVSGHIPRKLMILG